MKISKLTDGANLRWESSRMMISEHREALLKEKKRQLLHSPPQLDEQALQEIGIVVTDALYHELDVRIVYWKDGQFREVVGTIDQLDYQEKWIKVHTDDGMEHIAVQYLKNVERV